MIAERCQRVSGLWDEAPPLIGAYAFGHVLDGPDQLDAVQVALVLNHRAEELTWCARPTSCSGLPHLLELEKAPVEWYWRPAVWPVSNHVIVRPLRICSHDGSTLPRSAPSPAGQPSRCACHRRIHDKKMSSLTSSLRRLAYLRTPRSGRAGRRAAPP